MVILELSLAGLASGREISSLVGTLAGRRAESSGGLRGTMKTSRGTVVPMGNRYGATLVTSGG